MTDLPTAYSITRAAAHTHVVDQQVTLRYDGRVLRRGVLTTASGLAFLVDLQHTTSLDAGDAFELDDGRRVAVIAASEALLEVPGALTRLAWHIGNRHTPCQIEPDRLLNQHDQLMRDMLAELGAKLGEVVEPFTPEGGAYGHGRTHGHRHGAPERGSHEHGPHEHEHGPEHGHEPHAH